MRTLLREYLVALDTGNEFVADLLGRCTLDPPTGSAALLIPLARLPDGRPPVPNQRNAREGEQNAAGSGQDRRHSGARELDTIAGRA